MAANPTISEEKRKEFAGLYLLEYMINKPKDFALLLEREEADLETVLEWLLVKGWVEIHNKDSYTANAAGRAALVKFMQRYADFLRFHDVFCAVDLESGEFAFGEYLEFEDEEEWEDYLNEDRWEDLRIAVAEFKGIDPVEIVFMSFINEGRFGRDESGWQFDLLLGTVWEEIIEICELALHVDQLGYDSDEGRVSGEAVIADVIAQGNALMQEILEEDDEEFSGSLEHPWDDEPSDERDASRLPRVEMPPVRNTDWHRYENPRYRSPDWD